MARKEWAVAQVGYLNQEGDSAGAVGDGLTSASSIIHSIHSTKAEATEVHSRLERAVERKRQSHLLSSVGRCNYPDYTVQVYDPADYFPEVSRNGLGRKAMDKETRSDAEKASA